MSERSVLRLLKKNYPVIYQELSVKPVITNQEYISELFDKFLEAKGVTYDEAIKNKDNARMIFVAVIIQAYDPQFILDEDKPLCKGIRKNLSKLFRCQGPLISYISSSVRTYLHVYREFKEEVGYIYNKIVCHDESKNYLYSPK